MKHLFTSMVLITLLVSMGCERKPIMGQELPSLEESSLNFTCVHQNDVNPLLDAQADAWFKQARRIEKGQEPGSAQQVQALYEKAIEKGHWKALSNMAYAYAYGNGVEQNTDKAIDLLEKGMRMNIGRAYTLMGNLLAEGLGVKMDSQAAFAYHRKAADLGAPESQTLIGGEFLSNRIYRPEIGRKMLECAIAQGWGKAAFKVAIQYENINSSNFDQSKALKYFQLGVKFGDRDSARTLFFIFQDPKKDDGLPVNHLKLSSDPERSRRYLEIYDKIDSSPGIKFPDIDQMIPLPPSPLPPWRGPIGVMP